MSVIRCNKFLYLCSEAAYFEIQPWLCFLTLNKIKEVGLMQPSRNHSTNVADYEMVELAASGQTKGLADFHSAFLVAKLSC